MTIGIVLVWTLGLGVFFLDLFNAGTGASDGTIAARTLFGSIFGLTAGEARLAALLAVGTAGALLAIGAPAAVRLHRRPAGAGLEGAGAGARPGLPRAAGAGRG